MYSDLIPLLKVHEYFHGVSDEVLREVAAAGRVTQHAAGDVVHEANEPLTRVAFVLGGRMKAVRVDAHGRESLLRMIERGEQFGILVGALTDPVPIRVVALEPTALLYLDYEDALGLSYRHQDLRRLWLSTFAGKVRKHFFGTAKKGAPMLLALVHESPATRALAGRLIDRLRDLGERLAVFGDSDEWKNHADVAFRSLRSDGKDLELAEIRQQAAAWHESSRIIFDLNAERKTEWLARLLEIADRAVFFVPATAGEDAVRHLQALDVAARGWRDKIRVAWLLADDSPVVPAVPALCDLAARDFKIADAPRQSPCGRSLADGLERLVHDLRGVRIGVALGGGAARGMSHLGVLKALEQNGIVVDMIAGTSAGAMTGIIYASGLDPQHVAGCFAADLKPSWLFRHLRHGNHWYLVYKYRRGHFDPMLRKYLHDWRLEQLAVPCLSVTVDLVGGNSVVRERGDAVHAILESINLPVLSAPIVREGQALVDGGLVNNIPADVLVSMGCNFVIAVSVTAKLESEFCHIRSDRPERAGKRPAIIPTLFRSLLVQNYSLNAFGVQPADVVIEPDVTGFDMTEFMKAKELASIGEASALAQIPKIRQHLNRIDPELFPRDG
jgi:predicted acylesterase/phospholipase RssA/CRP-like cAMP-binding protein